MKTGLSIKKILSLFVILAAVSVNIVYADNKGANGSVAEPETEWESDEEADDEDSTENEGEVDLDDVNTRLNPVIEAEDDEIDIPIPSIINLKENHIAFNGADWSRVRSAAAVSATRPFSIVNIGDSHIQADIGTGTIRELLQYDLGNAGRGIITPLKMSGTNEPTDYTFSSTRSWSATKLMSARWDNVMGFTGTSIKYRGTEGDLTLGTSERDDYNPFSSVTIFHSGKMEVGRVTDQDGNELNFRSIPSRDYTQILLSTSVTRVKVYFTAVGDLTVYGASLSGERPGVYYHAIGNNGATYDTYNRIGNVGAGIAPLHPELVIISLGTNEAFGHVSSEAFYRSINRLVDNIRYSNPEAQILLVTPMECQKSVYTTVKKKVKVPVRKKSRKGKSRKTGKYTTKTVNTRVKSYGVNTSVKTLRDVIIKYGRENGIAVYDWYSVAGGDGASGRWIQEGLFSKDRVHHSYKGYHLQGRLLYEALIEALTSTTK
ncbi:MAG: hypothetical protein J1E84_06560 [Muribaculaceae bacterium]|nr:hypothetical protein [Muribaculaceae bacterium]